MGNLNCVFSNTKQYKFLESFFEGDKNKDEKCLLSRRLIKLLNKREHKSHLDLFVPIDDYDANDLFFYNMIEICLISIEKQLIEMFDVIQVEIDFEKQMCSQKNLFQSLMNIMDNYFVMTLGLMTPIDYPSPCKVVLYELHEQIKQQMESNDNQKIKPLRHFLQSFRKLMHDINVGINISGEYDLASQKKALDLFDLIFTLEYYITIFSMSDHVTKKQLLDEKKLSNSWISVFQFTNMSTLLYSEFITKKTSNHLCQCVNYFMMKGFDLNDDLNDLLFDLTFKKLRGLMFLYAIHIFNSKNNDFFNDLDQNIKQLEKIYKLKFQSEKFKTKLNDHIYENCKQTNQESVLFNRFQNMQSIENKEILYQHTLNYENESNHHDCDKHKKRNKILFMLKTICKNKKNQFIFIEEDLIVLQCIKHLFMMKNSSNDIAKQVQILIEPLEETFVSIFLEDIFNFVGKSQFKKMIHQTSFERFRDEMIMNIPMIRDKMIMIDVCEMIMDNKNIKLCEMMEIMLSEFNPQQQNIGQFAKVLEFISDFSQLLNKDQSNEVLDTLVYKYITIVAENSNKYHCGLHEKIVTDEPNRAIPKTKFQYNMDVKQNLKLIPSFMFSRNYDNKYYDSDFPVDVFPNKQNHEYTDSILNTIIGKGMKFSTHNRHENKDDSVYESLIDYFSIAVPIVNDQMNYKKKFNHIFLNKKVQNKYKKHPIYFLNMHYDNVADYIICFALFASSIKSLCKNDEKMSNYYLRYSKLGLKEKIDILKEDENKLTDGCPDQKTMEIMDKLFDQISKNELFQT